MNPVSNNKLADLRRPSNEFPREFVPINIDLADWDSIEPLYKDLHQRIIATANDLEEWLIDQSELNSVLSEEGARRYVAMTCSTDDENIRKEYLHFLEKIEPQIKVWGNKLDHKLLKDSNLASLDKDRYLVLIRDTRNSHEIFREENVPLETEIAKLSQEYQSIQGAMTVEFQGKEQTMQQMEVFQENQDRAIRKQAWEASSGRRLPDAEKLDELFDKMTGLRHQVAQNAGFSCFTDYRFRELGRFDYTSGDCLKFHDAVEKVVLPVYNRILDERKTVLGLETLRPWDLRVDIYNRPPLKPFSQSAELHSGCQRIFNQVDGQLGTEFSKMIENGLLDLDSRKGKAPGGYQVGLQEVRLPFIFMNAVGLDRDIYTLLHEGGHAFHLFEAREEPLIHYRHGPMEFCEVASMSMELIASNYLNEFYSAAENARSRKRHLEQLVSLFPMVAMIDAFQHWIYSHPFHTRKERTEQWLLLLKRFGGDIDYSGYENTQNILWQRILHIFEVPFYFIEYGIAQMGALQVWRNSRSDLKKAIVDYRGGLALGGSKPLPELFATANIKFDFSEETLKPLMEDIDDELEGLSRIEKSGLSQP